MASAILQRILDIAEEKGAISIKEANILIGELTFLDREQLAFALRVLSKETMAEKCKFKISVVKAKIKCSECGYRGKAIYDGPEYHTLNFAVPLNCPNCKGVKIKVTEGKEVLIRKIRLKVNSIGK